MAITNPIQYREGTEELVEDGLVINAETGLYTYTPREDGLVERFETGKNCVDANVWKSDAEPTSGRTVSWCFSAA